MIIWSSTVMSNSSAAFFIFRVNILSASLARFVPDGWLCVITMDVENTFKYNGKEQS